MAVRKLTCAGTTALNQQMEKLLSTAYNASCNNAGNISAADVRNNLIDIVDSIIENVASGDFSSTGKPFKNDLNLGSLQTQ